ncbi:hypothetical protein DPMN_187280 [Dreissena polymorpha]|uniref:Uncharacterized protein n=1 Tax=Dreissena polymorpha TaxID=45954 RepID=A0A9D4DRU3_DREPO|nr:hypothetical protein DPMN_187280 [Dreissena polymorpha]
MTHICLTAHLFRYWKAHYKSKCQDEVCFRIWSTEKYRIGRPCLVDKAFASGSGGRRFEPHGECLSKDGCLSWDLFRYGRLMSRER